MKISREELEQKMKPFHIGTRDLPNLIQPADAFCRAIHEHKRTKVPNVYISYLTREVMTDTQFTQRNLVIESVDRAVRSWFMKSRWSN